MQLCLFPLTHLTSDLIWHAKVDLLDKKNLTMECEDRKKNLIEIIYAQQQHVEQNFKFSSLEIQFFDQQKNLLGRNSN